MMALASPRRLVSVLALAAPSGTPLKAPPGTLAFRDFGADQGLTNLSAVALAQDPEGFLWLGTEDGLFRLEGDRFRRFGEEEGLPSSRIADNGLAAGLKHGLWVSTIRGMACGRPRMIPKRRMSRLARRAPTATARIS